MNQNISGGEGKTSKNVAQNLRVIKIFVLDLNEKIFWGWRKYINKSMECDGKCIFGSLEFVRHKNVTKWMNKLFIEW
jgi:hypothetical protein